MDTSELPDIRGRMKPDAAPSLIEELAEATYLLCVVAFYGPSVLLLLAPWLLRGLVLMGPFLAMLTVIVGLCAAATLILATGALIRAAVLRLRHPRVAPARRVPVRVQPELSR